MARSLLPLAVALAAAPVLAACGADSTPPPTTAPVAACRSVATPPPKTNVRLRKPTRPLDPTATWRATVVTNCGTFTIALDVAASPRTTASFVHLARKGFYDGLTFHRIAPRFVIQGGDPLGAGYGGPGYTIREPPPRATRYVRGVVAMAKRGSEPSGTSGSQFFIVTAQDARLSPEWALLGRVTDGLEVIDRIDRLPLRRIDPQGSPPVDPVVIERVVIRRS